LTEQSQAAQQVIPSKINTISKGISSEKARTEVPTKKILRK
jgi:hypothetical protein